MAEGVSKARTAGETRAVPVLKARSVAMGKSRVLRQLIAVRRTHFNKEQTPLASLRYQPTVSRWFFRCLEAHLFFKPLNCKIRFLIRRAINRSGAYHTGGQPLLAFAKFKWSTSDITWMSLYVYSRSLTPLVDSFSFHSQGNKKPCLLS